MKDLPVACTLSPGTLATRRSGLLPGLARRASAIDDLEDGLRLRFEASAGILHEIAAVIDAERLCCRFVQFDLRIPQDEGPFELAMTGPPGTREFLRALLAG